MDVVNYALSNKIKKYVDESVGNVPDEKITEAVNTYLEENPVAPGATSEQAEQIQDNTNKITEIKDDLSDLRTKELYTPENIFNAENATLGYMTLSGNISTSSSLVYTERINVSEGDVIRTYRYNSDELSELDARFITAFNGNTVVASKGAENTSIYTVPGGITSVVITISKTYTIEVTKNSIPTEYTEYFTPYTVTTVKPNVLPKASETDFGVAKMWVTVDEDGNKVLNISTGDENE